MVLVVGATVMEGAAVGYDVGCSVGWREGSGVGGVEGSGVTATQ